MTTYQRETFDEAYTDALPLLEAHRLEISDNVEVPLDVNVEAYQQSENAGFLRVYTARNDRGMVGYSAVFVHRGLHNQDNLQAAQDVFYVDPDWRGGMVGTRLLDFVEKQLKKEGVQIVYQTVKINHPMLGHLLVHRGYVPTETVYQRRLA
jgi:GNAT superfamily N-acetyltransferase